MAGTFLIVGATGNTGRSVVKTLAELVKTRSTFSGYRILAQTRSAKSSEATSLAQIPGVEIVEQVWLDITAEWLKQRNVRRVFIASHNLPNQFAEESTFLLAARDAGVEYLVRISTTAANVTPDCPAYYPRQHWAIEAMLGTPEFERLHWTSLQPNVFPQYVLTTAAELVKNYKKTGKQNTLLLMLSEDGPVGIIHPDDIGTFAAHLLVEKDTSVHNKAKYVMNGPEDITGRQIVEMVEHQIGTKVENVVYKDVSAVRERANASSEDRTVLMSIVHAPETGWAGKCTASTTSKEVLDIYPPRITPAEVFKAYLA